MEVYSCDFDRLTKMVVDALLDGPSEYFMHLRMQKDNSKLIDFNFDGYGYTIDFSVEPSFKIIEPSIPSDIISGLSGVNSEGDEVCGFAIIIRDGCLVCLDAYSLKDDAWPQENIFLKYTAIGNGGNIVFSNEGQGISCEKFDLFNTIKIASDSIDE